MEGVPGTHSASKLASEDVISSMPEILITNIMNRLPIRDAVRTSILARNWRLKWTLLTELVFGYQIPKSVGPDGKKYYDFRIISRLLLLLTGPVTRFVLGIRKDQILDVGEFSYCVLFLSRKGIKKFVLQNDNETPFKLPTHLFSCLELTHLRLHRCCIHLPPTFSGFPNLSGLRLVRVHIENGTFEEFIIRCPLLQIIHIDFYPRFKFNMDDIPILENVKELFVRQRELGNKAVITISSIFQLLGFLPKLEVLNLDCQEIVEDVALKDIPTVFPCLNTLKLCEINFNCGNMLSCVYGIIWGSPNLQELIIFLPVFTDADEVHVPPAELFSLDLGNNIVRQLQLQNVMISLYRGSKNEECLIKYLLASSPFLKRITIRLISSEDPYEMLRTAAKLLKLHRASPVADVDFIY